KPSWNRANGNIRPPSRLRSTDISISTQSEDADSDAQRQYRDMSQSAGFGSARPSCLRSRAHGRTPTSCSGNNRYPRAGVEPTFTANVGPSATLTLDSMECIAMANLPQKQVARTANGQFRPGVSGNLSGNVHRSRHA